MRRSSNSTRASVDSVGASPSRTKIRRKAVRGAAAAQSGSSSRPSIRIAPVARVAGTWTRSSARTGRAAAHASAATASSAGSGSETRMGFECRAAQAPRSNPLRGGRNLVAPVTPVPPVVAWSCVAWRLPPGSGGARLGPPGSWRRPMKRRSSARRLALWLATALLALGGCGKSSDVTGLGAAAQQTADDIAVQVGAAASADGGGLMTEIEGTNSTVPMASRPVTFFGVAASDTTFARGPFTITLDRTFYDVDDTMLQQWDPSAVRAVIDSWVRGAVTGLRYQATVGRTGVLNVNGLAAAVDTLLFDGTATDTTDARFT